jgi:hypothetical protein
MQQWCRDVHGGVQSLSRSFCDWLQSSVQSSPRYKRLASANKRNFDLKSSPMSFIHQVLRITNKKKPVLHSYTMHDQILQNVDQKPYLGVQFTNTLKWDTHINNILTKANTSLGFLRVGSWTRLSTVLVFNDMGWSSLHHFNLFNMIFLIWIPGTTCVKSKLRVFADASLLFLGLDCTDDCNQLQKDLDKLVNWASEWQMKFKNVVGL